MESHGTPLKIKLLISLVSFSLFFSLLEVGLRVVGFLFYDMHKEIIHFSYGSNEDSLTKKFNILCVGDSFTVGGEAADIKYETYPAQLSRILNTNCPDRQFFVINKGICESNTRMLLHHLPGEIEKYHPDIIILLIGAANRFNAWDYDLYANKGILEPAM